MLLVELPALSFAHNELQVSIEMRNKKRCEICFTSFFNYTSDNFLFVSDSINHFNSNRYGIFDDIQYGGCFLNVFA